MMVKIFVLISATRGIMVMFSGIEIGLLWIINGFSDAFLRTLIGFDAT